jgi:hypothetical protein
MENVAITFLDIIHYFVFCLKHKVLEIGCYLRLEIVHTQLGHSTEFSFPVGTHNFQLSSEVGDRIQAPKRIVLNERHDGG